MKFNFNIFENSTDALIAINQVGEILYWNKGAQSMFGYSSEEALGKDIILIIPEHFQDLHNRGLRRASSSNDFHIIGKTVEIVGKSQVGRMIPIELTISHWDEDGERFFSAIIRDITERKDYEKQIRESENKFRSITETSIDGIISIDKDGRIISWNRGAENLFGYTADEVIGEDILLIIPEEFQKRHSEGLKRASTTDDFRIINQTVEVSAKKKNGAVIPIELTISYWEKDNVRFFSAFLRDITERKRLFQEISDSEAKFRSITENSSDAIISINQKGQVQSWNNGARKMFGYEVDEVLGQDIILIIPEEFHTRHNEGLKRASTSNEFRIMGRPVEVFGKRKDNSTFPIELTISYWHKQDERFFSAIIRDITERKNAEKALQEKQEKLEIEKQRSEELLLNILPESIAEELKKTGRVEPVLFPEITVMFADFVGFTTLAETLNEKDLVGNLDTLFKKFDSITEKYKIEKIKTIGDSYMCASGIPLTREGHSLDCVLAAIEMLQFIKRFNVTHHSLKWQLRIGIHSGPIMAGVVGKRKFTYDIWGDTVNIASRMESHGIPGKINISKPVFDRVKDLVLCEHRGKIAVKNKEPQDMYVVKSFQPNLSVDGLGRKPSEEFYSRCRGIFKCQDPTCL